MENQARASAKKMPPRPPLYTLLCEVAGWTMDRTADIPKNARPAHWQLHQPVILMKTFLLILIFALPVCSLFAQEGGDYDQLVVNANSLLKQGELDQAQQAVQQAIKLNGTNYLAYAVAAKIASKLGDAEEANSYAQKALEFAPDEDKDKVRQLEEQLQAMQQEQQPSKTNTAAYDQLMTLAGTFVDSGNLDAAKQTAQQILQLDSQQWEGNALMATILQKQGDCTDSQSYIQKAIATAPQDEMAKLNAMAQTIAASASEENLANGEVFLSHNSDNPGIISLPDGLQYKVLIDGTGATPVPNDIVTVNYRGSFINGAEFDSSYKRGKPMQFAVNGVIRGWSEALAIMNVGSKWQLFIPSQLAYGEKGRPGIPPNSVLIFEVELLSTEHPRPASQ